MNRPGFNSLKVHLMIVALCMMLTVVFFACKHEDEGNIGETGVTLNKSTLSLTVGSTETLTATVLPTNATVTTVSWKSSDEKVATVSSGTVTAKVAGTATVTATTNNGNRIAYCTVTVTKSTTTIHSRQE